jgi:hypothetical protein
LFNPLLVTLEVTLVSVREVIILIITLIEQNELIRVERHNGRDFWFGITFVNNTQLVARDRIIEIQI